MHFYIEIAWAFSTVFGIFLFLIELAILCWVKFWDIGGKERSGQKAALAATLLLIPIGIVFIGFAIHFYRTLVSHKFERSERGLQELESMVTQLQTENQEFSPNPTTRSAIVNI
jgi:calcium release-activated calcium channel protein 1